MKRRQLARIDKSDPEKPKLVYDVKLVNEDLKAFKDGQRVWFSVETYYRKRTLEQNKTLHWYLNEISDETGIDLEEIKDVLKKKFLTIALLDQNGEMMADNNGELLERVKNTSELTTIEFNDFTEKIRMWANDYLNLQLPLPNEAPELKFKDIK